MSELPISFTAEEELSLRTAEQSADWAPVSVLDQVFTSCESTPCKNCSKT